MENNQPVKTGSKSHAAADRLVKLALLAAISIILVLLIRFPIIPQLNFLEYDMADVPILIGTFLYGPVWGLLLTLVVCVLQGVTVSANSGRSPFSTQRGRKKSPTSLRMVVPSGRRNRQFSPRPVWMK